MDDVDRLTRELQQTMARAGGRLSSLDPSQNPMEIGDNSNEGRPQPPTQGDHSIMANKEVVESKTTESKTNEEVPPAGGKSDAEIARALINVLNKAGASLEAKEKAEASKSFARRAAEASVTPLIVAGTAVAVYAAITVIDNTWGRGARQNKLIDSGVTRVKMLDAGGKEMHDLTMAVPSAVV